MVAFRYTNPGSIGVEWCCGTAPFGRASVREARSCVSFEKDQAIIDIVSEAVSKTRLQVMRSIGAPDMLKRKRPESAETFLDAVNRASTSTQDCDKVANFQIGNF